MSYAPSEISVRERWLLLSGVPTVRCDACGTLVARDYSWHECVPGNVNHDAMRASWGTNPVPTLAREETRRRTFRPNADPTSIDYVPEWAEKL